MTEFDTLVHLADHFYARFELHGKLADLSIAAVHYRSALELASSSPSFSNDARSKLLGNLANVLSIRFQRCGNMVDLARSIECHTATLELRPPGHPGRASTLANYATALLMRFGQLGVQTDIELAIEHLRAALEILPPQGPDRLMPLMNYASALFSRFQCTRSVPDLSQAISQYYAIMDICPPESQATACYNLANALLSRFKVHEDPVDLDSSIEFSRIAKHLLENDHPDQALIITGLATGLVRRFELRGDVGDLESAVKNFQLALELHPPGIQTRFSALSNLADTLIIRYTVWMGLPDLELAIDYYRDSLRVLPPKHKDEATLLNNLGNALFLRLTRSGDLKDLDEAIEKHRLAVNLHAEESDRLVLVLESLATCHNTRFERWRDPTDLHSAIHYFNEALLRAPSDHPHYPAILNSIASSFGTRFSIYGELIDLDRAIAYSREVLEILPPEHPDRAITLHTLAGALLHRFRERGDEFDLHQAYLHCGVSLSMRMSRETERAASELLYSRILRARLLPFSDTKDLEPIFELLRSAKEFGATDHSLLLDIYAELSTLHFLKYLLTQQPSELTEALGHHELSLAFSRGTSIPAFHASMQWVTDAELHGHSSGVEAYRTAMRLLDRLILEMRSPELRQCMVTRNGIVLAIDAGSCGIRFGQADEGVEMLEQGRELTWTQMVRVMTALDDLRATGEQGVALFNEFERLSAKLKSIPRISSVMSKSCKLLHKERESVIDQIRRKEGLKGFLLPPLFNHLQKVASDGPVIIVNASQYSCDAVIIWQTGQPAHVPLPDISLRDVSLMASKFAALAKASAPLRYDVAREKQLKEALSDLWDQVVYPIIKRLIPCTPRGARLWWCPTGKFTSIPLHAACPYRTGEPALSHVYVSSYTSTLSALARSRAISTPSSLHRTSLTSGLTVFLKNRKSKQLLTPPPSPLSLRNPPAALIAVGNPVSGEKNDQLDFIKMRIPPGVPFKRIEGEDMSVVTVTNALRETAWVHFTCPVVHNPARPFRTEFKTQDGNLTLYDIARIGPKVDFAFVSTCQNAKVDVGPVEEPMPLPSCLQYMGFKSVVGTIWPVDEEVTRRVVSVFYENVVSRTGGSLHHTDTAKVLNQALRAIEETVPLSQRIAFVHVGM